MKPDFQGIKPREAYARAYGYAFAQGFIGNLKSRIPKDQMIELIKRPAQMERELGIEELYNDWVNSL